MSTSRKKSKPVKKPESVIPELPPMTPIITGLNYTTKETAQHLRLKNWKSLIVWRCSGAHPELKFVKVGSRVIYRGEDILNFLAGKPAEESVMP